MDSLDFLHEERARKLAHVQVLMSGSVTITMRTETGAQDVSAEIIRETLQQVAQIDMILAAEAAA